MNFRLARLLLSVPGSEQGRKAVAWVLALVLSLLLLLVSVIAALASGEAQHNKGTVEACFYGTALSLETPAEFETHIREMRQAFSLLDSTVASINTRGESGGLDPIMVKAVFLALCFGEEAPGRRAAGRFVNCFYTETEHIRLVKQEDEDGNPITLEERTTVISPLPLSAACGNLSIGPGNYGERPEEHPTHLHHGGRQYGGCELRRGIQRQLQVQRGHDGAGIDRRQ